MRPAIKIFPTPTDLAETFAGELAELIQEVEKEQHNLTVCLSGGTTPELLFTCMGNHYADRLSWSSVHLFWGDERCVSPVDPESNYGMTKRCLLDKIDIPPENIHRIRGEDDPEKEAHRYSAEISQFTPQKDGLPLFDLIILGIGEDGHTASLFPDQRGLMTSDRICEVARHPDTGQRRITITGKTINNASAVVFMVTGPGKADVVDKIINKKPGFENFPASGIVPRFGSAKWLLDQGAGRLL